MRWIFALVLILLPYASVAQGTDDRSRIVRFLEDRLSDGDNRQVHIEGFTGALSSEAHLDRMTISDADGAWLVLEEATLVWSRSALLTGAVHIDALTAERLEILRRPTSEDESGLPQAEATPFALPEIPVSVRIDEFSIDEVVLDESIIGLPATLSVDGSANLDGGAGHAILQLERLDGPGGSFALDASYDNSSRDLALSLLLEEPEDGLTAELLNLPERHALRLSIEGEGPITDFSTEISLQTDGEDRLSGHVTTSSSASDDQFVTVDIGGDIRPLMLSSYQSFFGDDTRVQAQVHRDASGGITLNSLRLVSAALSLEGDAALTPEGLPDVVDLTGQITPPDGNRVRLPIGGSLAEIASADLDISFDRSTGEAFSLTVGLDRLSFDDLEVELGNLSLEGAVDITENGITAAAADLSAVLSGLSHRDPAMAEAIGDRATLGADISWIDGAPVILSELSLQSGQITATGGASAMPGDSRLDVVLNLAAAVGDLDRFAALASQPLDGSAELNLSGTAEPLSGAFDIAISGTGNDLRVAEAVPAQMFSGETQLAAQVTRDLAGISLRDLRLQNAEIDLTGNASITSGDTNANADFELEEVGYFTEVLSGPVSISADLSRAGTDPFDVNLTLAGPNEINAAAIGTFDAETGDAALELTASAVDLDVGNGVPPGILAGRTELSASLARTGDVLSLNSLSLGNPELTVTGEASISPTVSRVAVDARLANVGLITDALTGPVSANAVLTRQGTNPWQVASDLAGPGGMNANVSGSAALEDGSVDLRINGQAPLSLANRYIQPRSIRGTLGFDLAMQGAPGLPALSGRLFSNDARVSVPSYGLAIENVGLNAQISGGRVSLTGSGNLSTGGQLNTQGSINLSSPGLDGNITLSLVNGRVVDPALYNASITRADLAITGPLARGPLVSGEINLGETEVHVPEASLAGSAAIPDINFVEETRAERLTRRYAGLLGQAGGNDGGSAATGLDITINAPGRIYLRGRGIDAEFGGSIRLFGSTANVIPTGQFELVRGRLSVLGTRLDFVEGQATLQGSFDPFLRLAAVSRSAGYEITIRVEGASSSPDITFSSDPSLPEDEVLAHLLFGRTISSLSPLQLLQLADAATSLAGGSGNSGFIAGLRDNLGLDDLDFNTDAEGNAEVTAGRYLSENIYTDVTVNAQGDADLSLNIDLTPNFTARGSVGSDGSSSIGIFFEQDY